MYFNQSSSPQNAATSTLQACAPQKVLQDPQIIVGTHALLYDSVSFSNLGLAVIDEQHKFGVAQRARLTARDPAPDVLVDRAIDLAHSTGPEELLEPIFRSQDLPHA